MVQHLNFQFQLFYVISSIIFDKYIYSVKNTQVSITYLTLCFMLE